MSLFCSRRYEYLLHRFCFQQDLTIEPSTHRPLLITAVAALPVATIAISSTTSPSQTPKPTTPAPASVIRHNRLARLYQAQGTHDSRTSSSHMTFCPAGSIYRALHPIGECSEWPQGCMCRRQRRSMPGSSRVTSTAFWYSHDLMRSHGAVLRCYSLAQAKSYDRLACAHVRGFSSHWTFCRLLCALVLQGKGSLCMEGVT